MGAVLSFRSQHHSGCPRCKDNLTTDNPPSKQNKTPEPQTPTTKKPQLKKPKQQTNPKTQQAPHPKDGKQHTARLPGQRGDGKACVTSRQSCAQAGAAVGTVNPSRRGSQGLSSAGNRVSALRGAGREASPARDLIPLSFTHLSLAPSTSCEVEQTPVECPLVNLPLSKASRSRWEWS